jgi:fumarylacetoacetase
VSAAELDETHDPGLRSWLEDANDHAEFPIQNLPLGIVCPPDEGPQAGIAIGEHVLLLRRLMGSGLLGAEAFKACQAADSGTLNEFMALGSGPRRALRREVSAVLAHRSADRRDLLCAANTCVMLLPARVGDYTDFYAGLLHAENVGRIFRPENPLLPNYKWVPIGYGGRSSSICVSPTPVQRPCGQRKSAGDCVPVYGRTERLDFELELGIWVGPGNALGGTVPIDEAGAHIAGFCLLNDWSARDVQAWEYQPLGPFLGKNFQTSVSGWVVTPEALAPFRMAQRMRPEHDPKPLPYLSSEADQASGALHVGLAAYVSTAEMRRRGLPEHRLTRAETADLYWTPAQMLAHHTSNGCNLRAGDLFGSGTISSPTPHGPGSLLELTKNGSEPITLPSGEQRRFLEDGDEVIFRGRADAEGFVPIGFGECRGRVLPSHA